MKGAIVVFVVILALLPRYAKAQTVVPDRIIPDTTANQKQVDKSSEFFDDLKERAEDSRFYKRLYRALVYSEPPSIDTIQPQTAMQKEIARFRPYQGKRIDSINIYRANVFNGDYDKRDLRNIVNSLHVVTRENKIWKALLFKKGEEVSPEVFALNEQYLRSLSYLSDAHIVVTPDREGDGVIVSIFTYDSWSISATIRSVPQSRNYIDIYDNNFLGFGNRLDLRTYVSYKGKKYGGNMLEYQISNVLGTFGDLNLIAGKGYEEHHYGVLVKKPFLLPSDFLLHIVAEDQKYYEMQTLTDTMLLIRHQNLDFAGGKSWSVPSLHSSFFVTGGYQHRTFKNRPEIKPDSNTFYQSYQTLLIGTGIFRETYYRGNMIYGYGATEDVPYGHKVEIVGGRYWGEFSDQWYASMSAAAGRQTRHGYIRGEATISSFFDAKGHPNRSALEVQADAFSNLWQTGRSYIRQFLSVHYLNGFGRYSGEGETLTFFRDNAPRGMRYTDFQGKVRLNVNTETVLFTPIYFYGFRFTFFGFADLAWIGEENNPFVNDFYSTFGLGVRLKNERLIFSAIQLRLGFAVSKRGFEDYRIFRFNAQPHLTMPTFKAEGPDLFDFR